MLSLETEYKGGSSPAQFGWTTEENGQLLQAPSTELWEPHFTKARLTETQVDTRWSVQTLPADDLRDTEDPWTSVLGDWVGSGPGEIDTSLVVGPGDSSACFSGSPVDPVMGPPSHC